MTGRIHRIGRRAFLSDLGKGTVAVAILGAAACSDDDDDNAAPSEDADGGGASTTDSEPTSSTAEPGEDMAVDGEWRRVDLGFVSAYVLVRGGEAAVVDTGTPGSEGEILAGLEAAGSGWEQVRHVLLTHAHPDHVGSTGAVLEAAAGATGYAGEGDVDAIDVPQTISAVADGDEVFGLVVVATPGHTAGHISILDPAAGYLVAGDAMVNNNEQLTGAAPQFTADQAEADRSVAKLAGLEFETVAFGHGPPITEEAMARVQELAASL